MESTKPILYLKWSLCFLIVLFFVSTQNIYGQCNIQSIPDTTVRCGNAMQLRSGFKWQNKDFGGNNILTASCFTSKDTGYFGCHNGIMMKTTNGGNSWSSQNTNTTETLNSIFFVNENNGFAAGGNYGSSLFIKTTNGGQNWTIHNTGQTSTIQSIYFTSLDTGFAVGGNDLNYSYFIIKTSNGGISWNQVDSGGGFALKSIYFVNSNIGYACGYYGNMLKTSNGGQTWTMINTGTTMNLNMVRFLDVNNGYAIGSNTLIKTNNGGQTWTQKSFTGTINLVSAYFSDTLNGQLLDNYIYLKTKDGGNTWKSDTIGSIVTLNTGYFIDQNTAYMGGSFGTVRKFQNPISYRWAPSAFLSDSSAESPYASPIDSTTYILTVTFPGGCIARDTVRIRVLPMFMNMKIETTIACGSTLALEVLSHSYENPLPLKYLWWPNTGLNDSSLAKPTARPIADTKYYVRITAPNSCSLTDSTQIYVNPMQISAGSDKMLFCGDSAQLLGAPKWIPREMSFFYATDLLFTSQDTGFAIVNGIQKSTDKGQTWIQKTYSGSMLQSLFFFNKNIGFAVGENGTLLKTTNAGENWQLYYPAYVNLKSVFFTSPDTGYVVGVSGTVRKTMNGGSTWTVQSVGFNIQLNKVFFVSATNGFIIGNSGKLFKTSNGGNTWTSITTGTTNDLIGICSSDVNTIHIIGYNRTYMRSTDGGNTWTLNLNSAFWNAKSIVFTNPLTGYISGQTGAIGGIYNTVDGGLSWNLQEYPEYTDIISLSFPTPNCGYAYSNGLNRAILSLPPPADSYQWTPNSALSNANLANPFSRPNATTAYNLTIQSNGCVASDSLKVYVYPLIINNVPDFVYDPNFTCGSVYQMDTAKVNTNNSNIKFQWSPSIGLSDSSSRYPKVTLKNTITYTLTVTTTNGCISKDSVSIYANPFTVNAGPDVNRTLDHICGSQYQMDSVKTNTIENNLKYTWYPNIRLSDSLSINPLITIFDDITYHVVVTTPSGCIGYDSIHIEAYPFTLVPGRDPEAFCGLNTQLDSVQTNQTNVGPYTYNWVPSIGLNRSDIPNPITHLYNQPYVVSVSNKEGCVAKDSIYVKLTKMIPPELCIVSVDSNNRNLLIWDLPPSNSIDTYYVYKETNVSGQFTIIAALPYQQHNYFVDQNAQPNVQSNRYKISLKDSCGYETFTGTAHKTMHLTINKGVGNTWNLIWNHYEGFTANTYNIYRGSDSSNLIQIGTTAGTNNSYTDLLAPAGDVYYQVEIISPRPCALQKTVNSSRSNKTSSKLIGLNHIQAELGFKLYPNPAKDELTIEWNNADQNAVVMVYSMQGVLIYHKVIGKDNKVLPMQGLQTGLYLVEVNTVSGNGRKLLVKE